MREIEVTSKRVLAIWWLLLWRGTVGGAAIGFVVGFVIGFVLAAIKRPELVQTVSLVAGLIVGLVWGFAVLTMALRKKYRGFRIALVED